MSIAEEMGINYPKNPQSNTPLIFPLLSKQVLLEPLIFLRMAEQSNCFN